MSDDYESEGQLAPLRLPYATRQLPSVYKAVAKVVEHDAYIDMTQRQFVGECLKKCGGNVNPKVFAGIYLELMKDAGLKPI